MTETNYDYVIVGGGSAGSAAAVPQEVPDGDFEPQRVS
jgi:hypothetical protein